MKHRIQVYIDEDTAETLDRVARLLQMRVSRLRERAIRVGALALLREHYAQVSQAMVQADD